MAKAKNIFYCKECGTETGKWQGQCPGCGEWNTLVEAPDTGAPGRRTGTGATRAGQAEPARLKDITPETGDTLDWVLPIGQAVFYSEESKANQG